MLDTMHYVSFLLQMVHDLVIYLANMFANVCSSVMCAFAVKWNISADISASLVNLVFLCPPMPFQTQAAEERVWQSIASAFVNEGEVLIVNLNVSLVSLCDVSRPNRLCGWTSPQSLLMRFPKKKLLRHRWYNSWRLVCTSSFPMLLCICLVYYDPAEMDKLAHEDAVLPKGAAHGEAHIVTLLASCVHLVFSHVGVCALLLWTCHHQAEVEEIVHSALVVIPEGQAGLKTACVILIGLSVCLYVFTRPSLRRLSGTSLPFPCKKQHWTPRAAPKTSRQWRRS